MDMKKSCHKLSTQTLKHLKIERFRGAGNIFESCHPDACKCRDFKGFTAFSIAFWTSFPQRIYAVYNPLLYQKLS